MDKAISWSEVIDLISLFKDIDQYDGIPKTCKSISREHWRTILLEAVLRNIIAELQTCYLNAYEYHLLRKYHKKGVCNHEKTRLHDLIQKYYRFLVCFDLMPFIKCKSNNEVMLSPDDLKHPKEIEMFSIEEYWYPYYKRIESELTISEMKQTKAKVASIVKQHTEEADLTELKRRIMDIIQVDEEFKAKIPDDFTCTMKTT